jgi:hypothetical protein
LRTKYTVFHRVPKQFDKFFFVDDQVDTVVLSVFIFAKSQRFPSPAFSRKKISFDSTFVVIVELTGTNGSIFDGIHLGHKASD